MKKLKAILTAVGLAALLTSCGTVGENSSSAVSSADDNGVNYSYFLELPMNREYKSDYDGLSIQVVSYGHYISTVISNNGTAARQFGGDYRIQRNMDGVYVDVPYDTFDLIYAGTNVKDMPHITARYYPNGETIELPSADSIITIEPDEQIQVDFLALNHEIYALPQYAGEYRLVYGGMEAEFDIECDVAQ